MKYILGLNINHSDTSACLIKNDKLICAIEEERLNRIKHTNSFPYLSIQFCLDQAQIKIDDLDYICINSDSKLNFKKKVKHVLNNFSPSLVVQGLKSLLNKKSIKKQLKEKFNSKNIKAKICYFDHHLCHLASSYYFSNFEQAICISIDGFGDFSSLSYGSGIADKISIDKKIYFPHSFGILYQGVTQFLGFENYGDEYKVMGLASYGKPVFLDKLKKLINIERNSDFKLNLDYFEHHKKNLTVNLNQQFFYKDILSQKFEDLTGFKKRKKDEEIKSFHIDLAKSMQCLYEDYLINLINFLYKKYQIENLCLSGGCAANSVANGKILEKTKIKKIYIPPSPGDAGGSLGAAVLIKRKKDFLNTASLGPEYSKSDIENYLKEFSLQNYNLINFSDQNDQIKFIIKNIVKKKIVGLFTGKMEFGSRALGNRSIIADPRESSIRDIINSKTKKRESFRPFAPAILKEKTSEWFEINHDVNFMSEVYYFKKEKSHLVPSVVHVDGTGRLQTVDKKNNNFFYNIIKEFYKETGVPILLNTSFNENEPIVCTPRDAIKTFLKTKIDILVLENFILARK